MVSGIKWEVIEVAITCKMCGTANNDGVKFCSACGSELAKGDSSGARDAKPKAEKAKTIIMGMVPVTQGAASGERSSGAAPGKASDAKGLPHKPAAAAQNKTVIGVATISGAPSPAAKPAAAVPVSKASRPRHQTMLGVAAPVVTQKPVVKTASPAGAASTGATSKPPMARAIPVAGKAQKPTPGPAAKPARVTKKTMLGMPALTEAMPPSTAGGGGLDGEDAGQGSNSAAAPPEGYLPQATEPIEALRAPAAAGTQPVKATPSFRAADTFNSWPDEMTSEEPRRSGLLIALVVVAVVVIGVGAVLAYLTFSNKSIMVTPQVFPSPDGKQIIVSLPLDAAPQGTVVRFGEQAAPVSGGKAQITIPMSELKLGSNDITLSYVEPSESPVPLTFPIVLRHTITDDLTGLDTDKPYVSVIFNVAPSIQLSVEGKRVAASRGSFAYRIPLETLMASAKPGEDQIVHDVSFQLTDQNGVSEKGQHGVVIPITDLQVDRPSDKTVTQADTITCSGTTEEDAKVLVNGAAAEVTAGRFSAAVSLSSLGDNTIEITAQAPEKAPGRHALTVQRIESFDAAIAEWSKDLDESLDYPTVGRDPDAQAGKKIKLNGRVVNISTEKGVTAFILYVREGCPARGKCAVYVVFRGETDAKLQSWVDVYGTVRGTRSVDLQQGLKIEVPAVDAVFVIESEPKKAPKRRRRK